MKKLFLILVLIVATLAWAAKPNTSESVKTKTFQQVEKYCPDCKTKLVERYVKVGKKECQGCKGKGWYGTANKTKEQCRRDGFLCDPCNYCHGKRYEPIMGWRWVCPDCNKRYK